MIWNLPAVPSRLLDSLNVRVGISPISSDDECVAGEGLGFSSSNKEISTHGLGVDRFQLASPIPQMEHPPPQ